jgi:D-glycero-beta-D-manno-heptose-7-phosphate kinase
MRTPTPSAKRVAEIMASFGRARIAVIGDFVADVYLHATPTRLSREAPVMIVSYQSERMIPGGAANAVNNLLALGAQVVPIGVVGDDRDGRELARFFAERCDGAPGLVVQPGYGTVSKTRIMVGGEGRSHQQVLRIDREPERTLAPETRAAILARVQKIVPAVDAVLFSDYGYSLIDGELVDLATMLASGGIVSADSRYALEHFKHVHVVTPNHAEAAEIVHHPVVTDEESASAGRTLLSILEVEAVVVTRGNRGMMLLELGGEPCFIPAAGYLGEVTDVSGAGDTVISVLTLARVARASYLEAAVLSNFAAGVVVTKLGAATCSPEELMKAATMAATSST